METVFLSSQEIASATYDSERCSLQLEMRKGGIYEVEEVPAEIYKRLISAPSPGTYYHQHIRKGDYKIIRLR